MTQEAHSDSIRTNCWGPKLHVVLNQPSGDPLPCVFMERVQFECHNSVNISVFAKFIFLDTTHEPPASL